MRHQRVNRLIERQADNGEHLLARQRIETMRGEGAVHRGDDHVLAVDQRAIAIENDKAEGRGQKFPAFNFSVTPALVAGMTR